MSDLQGRLASLKRGWIAAAALSCVPTLAHGQAAHDAPGAAASPTGGSALQEIVVTAQKRSENLQKVPVAVTALSGASVDALHAVTIQGLQGAVPNVQISNFTNTPYNAVLFIRGVGVLEVDPFAGNTVSVVLDGVPQYFSYGALVDLFDVNRVEVLRGPQGTLFGANTTGGVINVLTNQPTGQFGGKAEISYGNYNRIDVKAALDFPVSDTIAGKVDFLHSSRDGYFRNIVNGQSWGGRDTNAIRAYLKYSAGSDFDATLIGEYSQGRNGSPPQANGALPGDLGYVAPGTVIPGSQSPMYASPCASINDRCHAPDQYLTASDGVPDESNLDSYRATFTMNWRNSGLGDITAITGYRYFRIREFADQDSTPLNLLDTNRRTRGWQLSQEIRSDIRANDRLRFLVGGFLMKTHYDHFMNVTLDVSLPGLRQYNTQDQSNWSESLFGQAFYNLTDKLRFQAGIRYTHERTRMIAGVENFLNPNGPALLFASDHDFPDTALGGIHARGAKSWNNLGWKFGLDYQVTPDTLLYGTYTRGFKSGGFVGRIILPQDIGPYNPEKVDTFELGVKASALDRRLRANLALFYTIYRNMQVAQTYLIEEPDGTAANGTTIFNAGRSNIKGFEFEATALPFRGLSLNGSLAYLDARYAKFNYFEPDGSTQNLKGYRLQNAPKWTFNGTIAYSFAIGGGKLSASGTYQYSSSKYFSSVVDAARALIQPTHLVNANIDWSPEAGRWSIGLWANNLFDKRYIQSVVDAPGFYDNVGYAPPREFGGTFKIQL